MRRRQAFQTQKPQTTPKPPEADDLVKAYVAKFGKKPHWKMRPETIRERVNDPCSSSS